MKTAEAKSQQGYVDQAETGRCVDCVNYKVSAVHANGKTGNKRCGIGGFAISKEGTCAKVVSVYAWSITSIQ